MSTQQRGGRSTAGHFNPADFIDELWRDLGAISRADLDAVLADIAATGTGRTRTYYETSEGRYDGVVIRDAPKHDATDLVEVVSGLPGGLWMTPEDARAHGHVFRRR